MGRGTGDGFLPLEIVAVLLSFRLFAAYQRGAKDSLALVETAQLGAGLGVLADPLGDDVAGTSQGLLRGGDFLVVDEGGGCRIGVAVVSLREELLAEWLRTRS